MTSEAMPGPGHNKPPLADILAEENKALIATVNPVAAIANELAPKLKNGIQDEDMLAKVSELVVKAKEVSRALDKRREEEKKPFLEGGRTVDAFFKAHTDRLARIATAFTDAASDYQRRKAAEERRRADEEARKLRDEEERKRQEAVNAKREETTARKLDEADEIGLKAQEAEANARAAGKTFETIKTETGVKVTGKTEWAFEIVDYDAIDLARLRPFIDRDAIEKALKAYTKINKGSGKIDGVRFYEDVKASFRR